MRLFSNVDMNYLKMLEAFGHVVEFMEGGKFRIEKKHPRFGHMGTMIRFNIDSIKSYTDGLVIGTALAQDKWWHDIWTEMKPWENKLKCRIPAEMLAEDAKGNASDLYIGAYVTMLTNSNRKGHIIGIFEDHEDTASEPSPPFCVCPEEDPGGDGECYYENELELIKNETRKLI